MRNEDNLVLGRRAKMGAKDTWFQRRRGGAKEKLSKGHGWRSWDPSGSSMTLELGGWGARGPPTSSPRVAPHSNTRRRVKRGHNLVVHNSGEAEQDKSQEERIAALDPEATLQVPFTVGSKLLQVMQNAENDYSQATGCKRVRVVEGGGDKLVNTLGRNNPWSSKLYCSDSDCQPCKTRKWLREQQKEAKKGNTQLPKFLLKQGSGMCRREGINYSLQCITCLSNGVDSQYKGESSRSGRQRMKEHRSTLDSGLTTNPLVVHSV